MSDVKGRRFGTAALTKIAGLGAVSVLMILFNMLHSEQCLALSRCSNHIFNELSEQMNKSSVMLIRNMNMLKEGHRKYCLAIYNCSF